jgi:2-(1,2-epoxy-1,2-dihydrophenyl)acetyl-CoA isomerase
MITPLLLLDSPVVHYLVDRQHGGKQMAEAKKAQEEDCALYKQEGAIAVITLNRPDKLNSFNEMMHSALGKALERAITDKKMRALILTGAGRGFCAGQDLTDRTADAGKFDLSKTVGELYNPLIMKLRTLPFPCVAAVNGVAAGAGANIAFACDIVIAANSAKFIQSFSKIGLIPDSGGTWSLPKLVGRGKAFALAALSEAVSAEEAERIGLIYKAVEDVELMPAAQRIAAQLAAIPTGPLVKMREMLDASQQNDLKTQLALECEVQAKLGASKDYAEGVKAFFEKRAPKYSERT